MPARHNPRPTHPPTYGRALSFYLHRPWLAGPKQKEKLLRMLQKSLTPSFSDISAVPRADVLTKKIIRACKTYLDREINTLFQHKSRRNKRVSFIKFTDLYVKHHFNQGLMKYLGLDPINVSNMLASFIQPKKLRNEIDEIRGVSSKDLEGKIQGSKGGKQQASTMERLKLIEDNV
jgi:hypothetical protein